MYRISRSQKLPIDIDTCWDYFSSPKNLEGMTPDNLKFKIIYGADTKMFSGQIIKYKVSPFLGINMKWVTEITHVTEKEYFVDEQRFGPYKFWHHKHFFKEIEGGVEIIDIVDYELPLGVLGSFAHILFVKKQLKEIFAFRHQKLEELFGKYKG
ncbi:SRPBCC family protein [Aureivirga sp. CE67]|uniref:SRPBCC family protein n=1 Tax=Aureivirga sp. CE67 TaxID=1788983 RepID=UPI0018C9DC08|nr:SRPBCC family protein [Aureivirga sp. CE67]